MITFWQRPQDMIPIAGKLWSKKHSSKAYVDPGEAMEACIQIINREIKLLAAIGIDVIQLDEP